MVMRNEDSVLRRLKADEWHVTRLEMTARLEDRVYRSVSSDVARKLLQLRTRVGFNLASYRGLVLLE